MVLEVTPYYPPDFTFGGPVRLVEQLATRLLAHTSVTVATYQHSDTVYHDPADLIVQRLQPWSRSWSRHLNIYGSFELNRFLKQTIPTCQLVHTHDYRSFHNFALAKVCRQRRIPLVMSTYKSITPTTGRALMKQWFDRLGGKIILQTVNHFIAVNQSEVDDLTAYGIPDDRITIIPNATDVPIIVADPKQFRADHDIKPDQPLLLFYSRLHEYKRPDLAVAALPLVLQRVPNAVLILYGPDHGALINLKKQIEQLHISNRVRIIAKTANGQDHDAYAAADVLVLPSPYNEFPLVLLEAMGHSLPIVTCEQSIQEYIHNQCGLVVEPTAEAIAAAVTTILTKPEISQQFRSTGRRLYEQHFTFDRYAEQVWKVYQSCFT